MKIKKVQSVCLILACVAAGLIGCGKKDETSKQHEALTFMAPYLDVDSFIEEVHKTYPEIELEVVPYSGANTTTCLQNMLEADDLPDICTQTFYKPDVVDVSDKMIDLSGYDFTDNYVESRLKEVSDDGALYMLPSLYNCYGITYNKTLLEQHGWKLPTSFTELEELAGKTAEAYGTAKKNIKTINVTATVTIKDVTCKVTAIADQAFAGQKKATKAVIGANVTKIGKKAFYGDSRLKSITVKGKKLKMVGKQALKGINKKAVIRIPKSKKKAYRKLFKGKGQKKSVIVK